METFAGFIVGVVLTFICLLPLLSDGCANRGRLKKEAISNHFAEYNPTNGNWQWRTNK